MQLLLVSRGHDFVHESRGESIVSPRAAWRDVSRHEIRSASRLGFGMIVHLLRVLQQLLSSGYRLLRPVAPQGFVLFNPSQCSAKQIIVLVLACVAPKLVFIVSSVSLKACVSENAKQERSF